MSKSDGGDTTPDQRELRDALGCFPTGVIVMTCVGGSEGLIGVTLNSFSSVSLDPPLVSFCLADSLSEFDALMKTEHFALNVLCADQDGLSTQFAKSGPDKWRGVEHRLGANGAPIIESNLAVFECSKYAQHECGDHVIVVANVEAVEFDDREAPLIFHRGQYRRLSA